MHVCVSVHALYVATYAYIYHTCDILYLTKDACAPCLHVDTYFHYHLIHQPCSCIH